MLLIAGGVSAVLLSRGGEAISDLEAASVGVVTEATCPGLKLKGVGTASADLIGAWDSTARECTITGAANNVLNNTHRFSCQTFGGVLDTAGNGKCTVGA